VSDYFTLEFLNAKHGDCLLLHYGPADAPRLIVIDGGPATVYANRLKGRLDDIRKKRKTNQLEIRMAMVSHIDDDHINGVCEWFAELRDLQDSGEPLPCDILTLWHNSFDDLIAKTGTTSALQIASNAPATASVASLKLDPSGFKPQDKGGAAEIIASVKQGRRLRLDADALSINMNSGFDDLIQYEKSSKATANQVNIGTGLKFTVLGPRKEELDKLREKWKEDLPKILKDEKKKKGKASEFLDRSIPNLSSVVVLAEFGGKTMLLTGDARGDNILESLAESPKVLKDKLPLDILKVPHHGSHRNAAVKFFKEIPAKNYVISAEGDGKHPNPAQKTFEELFEARPKGPYTIWMTNTAPKGVKALKKLPPGVKLNVTPKTKSSERIDLLDTIKW
jgi:hypothetical protein